MKYNKIINIEMKIRLRYGKKKLIYKKKVKHTIKNL